MSSNVNYIKGLDRIIIVFVGIVSFFYFLETFNLLETLFGFTILVVSLCSFTRFIRWAIPWIKQGFLDEEE